MGNPNIIQANTFLLHHYYEQAYVSGYPVYDSDLYYRLQALTENNDNIEFFEAFGDITYLKLKKNIDVDTSKWP